MNIFSKIKETFTFFKGLSSLDRLGGDFRPLTNYNNRGLPPTSKINLINSVNSVVYSAIEINANAFSKVGWRVFRELPNGRIQEEPDSIEAIILRSVNPFMEGTTLNYLTSAWKDSAGCAFWWIKKRENSNIPEAIFPLSPSNTTPMLRIGTMEFESFQHTVNGKTFTIPAEDVIRFYNPSLSNPFIGTQSPLQAIWREKGIWDEESKNALALLQNHARPDALINPKSHEGQMGGKDLKRFEKELRNKFKGIGAGGILVSNTALEYTPLIFSSKDAELLARKGITKVDILNAFGVPVAIFDNLNANKSILQTAMVQHGTFAIAPRIKAFEDTLNEKYFPMFNRASPLRIKFDDPIPVDAEQRAKQEEQDLKNGVITINEVRQERGRDPVEWGDEPWFPTNQLQPTTTLQILGAEPNVKKLEDKKQNAKKIQDVYQEFIEYKTGKSDFAILSRVARENGIKQETINKWCEPIKEMRKVKTLCCSSNYEKLADFKALNSIPSSTPLQKVFRDIFEDQEKEVLKALSKEAKAFDGIRVKAFPDDAFGFLNAINLDGWEERTAKRSQPQITIDTSKGVDKTVRDIKAGIPDFSITSEDFMELQNIEEGILKQVISLSDETVATTTKSLKGAVNSLKKELIEGLIDEGDALPSMVKRVQAIFKNAKIFRAQAIAVTESNKAFNNGTLISAQESNVVKAVKWILSPDPCIICRTIEATQPTVPVGAKFTNADKLFGDVQHPPAHVNCECTLGVVLIDF